MSRHDDQHAPEDGSESSQQPAKAEVLAQAQSGNERREYGRRAECHDGAQSHAVRATLVKKEDLERPEIEELLFPDIQQYLKGH